MKTQEMIVELKALSPEEEIEALNDVVICEEIQETHITKGGIVIPDIAQRRNARMRVVSVGPGAWKHGVFVKNTLVVGDEVIVADGCGQLLSFEDGDLLAVTEQNVITRIRKKAKAFLSPSTKGSLPSMKREAL
jgi:co-chaperonin GroES (HSP10)